MTFWRLTGFNDENLVLVHRVCLIKTMKVSLPKQLKVKVLVMGDDMRQPFLPTIESKRKIFLLLQIILSPNGARKTLNEQQQLPIEESQEISDQWHPKLALESGYGVLKNHQRLKNMTVNKTHHQRAHIHNAKHDMFPDELQNHGLVVSMDDKVYLRPGTDVGARNTKSGGCV